MTEIEVERLVANTVASLAMEEMYSTEKEKEIMKKIVRGEITAEEANRAYRKELLNE